MKRAWIAAAVVLVAAATLAAQTTNPPASQGQPQTQAPTQGQPAQGQPAQGQAGAPQTAPGQATAPAQPAANGQPQAKTKAEFDAYQAVIQKPDAASMEAAANDFANQYPDSELRYPLYAHLMGMYRQANNPDKTVEMADKVAALRPDDPLALITKAEVLAETTRSTDLDSQQKFAAALQAAQHGLQTINTNLYLSANATPEQVAQAKNVLMLSAYSAKGMVELKQGNDAGAETDFKSAVGLSKDQPDPVLYLRLALAQDHLKKYPDALASADMSLKYAQPNSLVATLAKQEHDRLAQLTGASQPAPTTPPKP